MSVLVVGDVIDDILVAPSGPIRPDTDTNAKIQVSSGGSAANFACWLSSFGVKVDFVGRVNTKDVSRHRSDLELFGVRAHLQEDKDLATGTIVVLVEGNQRSFLTDRGANQNLEIDSIDPKLFSKALYISGYSLLSIEPQKVKELISRAKLAGSIVVCDPGSAGFIEDFGVNKFLETLAGVDLILPSLEEGRILTGEDRPEIIAEILGDRFPTVALTLGELGVQVFGDGQNIRTVAPKADLVDVTGAGDAFAASFLKAILAGKDLETASKLACKQGAIAVTKPGGRPTS